MNKQKTVPLLLLIVSLMMSPTVFAYASQVEIDAKSKKSATTSSEGLAKTTFKKKDKQCSSWHVYDFLTGKPCRSSKNSSPVEVSTSTSVVGSVSSDPAISLAQAESYVEVNKIETSGVLIYPSDSRPVFKAELTAKNADHKLNSLTVSYQNKQNSAKKLTRGAEKIVLFIDANKVAELDANNFSDDTGGEYQYRFSNLNWNLAKDVTSKVDVVVYSKVDFSITPQIVHDVSGDWAVFMKKDAISVSTTNSKLVKKYPKSSLTPSVFRFAKNANTPTPGTDKDVKAENSSSN